MKRFLPKSINPRGFTLVELLVVVAIIAVLSVIGLTTFTSVQASSRDARRKEDVDAIAKALEVNYNNTSCQASTVSPYCVVSAANASTLFSSSAIPANPTPTGASCPNQTTYFYNGRDIQPGTNFIVCGCLENLTGNFNDSAGATAMPAGNGRYYCRKNQQ